MDALVLGGVEVRDFEPEDHAWAERLLGELGGGSRRVARLGELIDPFDLQGLVAVRDGAPVGLATVQESPDRGMEIVTLHAEPRGVGAGTALVEAVRQVAAASGHHRLWLVTTNDNLSAIGFYLHRGFHVVGLLPDAVDADRALKPEIPALNRGNGLPIRDLVELALDPTGEAAGRVAFPAVSDLDLLPAEAVVDQLGVLFEAAPRFLAWLAAARPFGDDEGLVSVALQLGRELPEEEAIELVNAHPRIGADPESLSDASRAEQGYDREEEADGEQDGREPSWVAEELAGLNEVYEARFGFRFTVFVAGRPRSAIIPLIETALRNDREAELRRAVDDCIRIAADRLLTLRGGPPPEPEEWA
jgi:2-oxo-4-hydroxy-4-carboxy--5-ureidoimidazoline (OHCU) decarboxylase/ribosomal protein S18 acetylase RimI-like enzyme